MRLESGPFPVLQPYTAAAVLDDGGFTGLVAQELASLPAIEDSLDAGIDPATIFPDQLEPDGSLDLLAQGAASLDSLGSLDLVSQAAAIEPLKALGDEGIVTAYEVIPGEAFQPVPDPFAPDGGGGGVVTANPLSIELNNLDRPGALDFFVGERYQVKANITLLVGGGGVFAGVSVLLFPWVENVPQASINLGVTDQYGFLTAVGTFLPDQTGNWGATFYSRTPDAVLLAGPTVFWTVAPGAGAPVVDPAVTLPGVRTPLNIGQIEAPPAIPTTITVKLVNLTDPEDGNFRSADNWRLTVGGLPNLPVVIWGTFQGQTLTPVELGSTDDTGLFVLEGHMTPFHIGAWIERYNVGGEDWPGSLSFAVTD